MPQENTQGDNDLKGSEPKENLEDSVSLDGERVGDKSTDTTRTR